MPAIKSIIEKYLLLWLVLSSGLAFWLADPGGEDIFRYSQPHLLSLVAVTMFAIGWLLPQDEVKQVARRWRTVLGGTAIQYLAMPTLAFLMVRLFAFETSIAIGIIMVGCVPGAMASNVLTLMARGNTSYSVSLTTMATLLSPIVVPLALWLALGESISNEIILASAQKLTLAVVVPVLLGHGFARLFPKGQTLAQNLGPIIANLTILWIVATVVATNRERLQTLDAKIVGALLLLNLLGFLAGYAGGRLMRLPAGMQRALTLEVGMQNAGLGTALVGSLFPGDSAVTIPAALYTFGCMLTGTTLAYLWGIIRKA